jgi:hypothetical protein
MDISGDNNHVSYDKAIDYFIKQFPSDLAQMMAARDELAQRQGAISAVQDANKLRAEADVYAATSKATSDDVLVKAKADATDAKAKKAEADDLVKSLTNQRAELDAYVKAKEKELTTRENSASSREDVLVNAEAALKVAQDKLVSDQAEFDARIKAFQDKVNSLSV